MTENVYPTLEGTKHARLIYYYMLLQECETKAESQKVRAVSCNNSLLLPWFILASSPSSSSPCPLLFLLCTSNLLPLLPPPSPPSPPSPPLLLSSSSPLLLLSLLPLLLFPPSLPFLRLSDLVFIHPFCSVGGRCSWCTKSSEAAEEIEIGCTRFSTTLVILLVDVWPYSLTANLCKTSFFSFSFSVSFNKSLYYRNSKVGLLMFYWY